MANDFVEAVARLQRAIEARPLGPGRWTVEVVSDGDEPEVLLAHHAPPHAYTDAPADAPWSVWGGNELLEAVKDVLEVADGRLEYVERWGRDEVVDTAVLRPVFR